MDRHYSTSEACESGSESGRPLRLPTQASQAAHFTILGLGLLILESSETEFLGRLGLVVGRLRLQLENCWKVP